jgi:hypothetical protein
VASRNVLSSSMTRKSIELAISQCHTSYRKQTHLTLVPSCHSFRESFHFLFFKLKKGQTQHRCCNVLNEYMLRCFFTEHGPDEDQKHRANSIRREEPTVHFARPPKPACLGRTCVRAPTFPPWSTERPGQVIVGKSVAGVMAPPPPRSGLDGHALRTRAGMPLAKERRKGIRAHSKTATGYQRPHAGSSRGTAGPHARRRSRSPQARKTGHEIIKVLQYGLPEKPKRRAPDSG